MSFDKHKKDFLSKTDKSKKGSIDKPIGALVKKINKSENYYTTSSCSGRIVLLLRKSAKKQDISWLFKSHVPIKNFNIFKNKIKKPIEKKANKKDFIVFFKNKKIKQKKEISKIQTEYSRSEALGKELLVKNEIWFRYEPAIFHIACRTIDDAQKLVNFVRSIGFKRSGIQATRKKIMVEVCSSDIIDTIIAKNGKLLVSEDYLEILIKEANKKLKNNKEKLRTFLNKPAIE